MKYTWNVHGRRQKTQRHLYSTENGVRVGYQTQMKYTPKKWNVHGQCKKLASPNAKDTNMLVFLASANAKVLLFALPDAKVPDARYFAFWWNIDFIKIQPIFHCDAKPFALGTVASPKRYQHVGIFCVRWHTFFALPNAKPQRKSVEYRLPWVPNWIFALAMYISCFFVLISFAFVSHMSKLFKIHITIEIYLVGPTQPCG